MILVMNIWKFTSGLPSYVQRVVSVVYCRRSWSLNAVPIGNSYEKKSYLSVNFESVFMHPIIYR